MKGMVALAVLATEAMGSQVIFLGSTVKADREAGLDAAPQQSKLPRCLSTGLVVPWVGR